MTAIFNDDFLGNIRSDWDAGAFEYTTNNPPPATGGIAARINTGRSQSQPSTRR